MEKHTEQKLRIGVKNKGGLALKLVCPGYTGVPDRLILMPKGKLIFAELKFGNGKLSVRQEAVHRVLRSLGFEVWVVNEVNINEYLEKL